MNDNSKFHGKLVPKAIIHQHQLFEALCIELRPRGFYLATEYVIGKYRVDIYVHPYWVIEVDGRDHLQKKQIQQDVERDIYLHSVGKKVIRVTNHSVRKDCDIVVESITSQVIPHFVKDKTLFRSHDYKVENGRLCAS